MLQVVFSVLLNNRVKHPMVTGGLPRVKVSDEPTC